MLIIDDDLTLTFPQGDTGMFLLRIKDGNGQQLPPINGVGIFAVCKEMRNGRFATQSRKAVEIVDNTVTIRLANAVSRTIEPGDYRWDIRIVTDPEIDDDGNVICEDDTDEVHSVYAGRPEGMPKCIVRGAAVDV